MTDQLKLLPPFTWRDVQYPVTRRSYTFAHESVQHKWQRKNGDFVEQTGAHNPVLSYEIPLVDGLYERLGYGALFTDGIQRLLDDFRNREPGDLFDPVYGLLRCVPASYSDDLEAQRRSGVSIRLEFKHSPEREDESIAVTPISAISEAETLAVEAVSFETEASEAGEISPNTSVKLTETLKRLSDTGRAILATPNDVRSEVGKIAYWAREIEDITHEATSVGAILTRHRARETRDKAQRALDNSLQIRPARTEVTTAAQTLSSLAAGFNVDFQAFLNANRTLANRPIVPVGTTVVVPDA